MIIQDSRLYSTDSTVNMPNVFFFSLGILINTFSYLSIMPALVAAIFYFITIILLKFTPFGGIPEQRMFNRVFSIGFLMAGLAAVYANQLHDFGQLFSDAGGFFEMATSTSIGLSLDEIKILYEGSLAIILWREIYDFFALLGFEKERYIGITVNITAVAFTGVIGIKIIRLLFGNDEYRFRRLTLLMSACGLFWLFASIHMRDSVILLAITAFTYVWVKFILKPDLSFQLAKIITWSLLAFAFLGYMRGEFIFIPVATTMTAIAALYMGRVAKRKRAVIYGLMILGSFAVGILFLSFASDLQSMMDKARTGYSDLAGEHHGADSLGIALIVNQPLPIRLVLGSIYLFIFPIPFWSGFQLENAYFLFKSANVIFFYFFLPLLVIAVLQIFRNKALRTPALLFMLLFSAGLTMAIAVTSLETRHFGALLMPLFVLATLPDLRVAHVKSKYKAYLFFILSTIVAIHLVWTILKLI